MVLEGLWLATGKGVYANLFRYWLKIFAVVFAMGVVSGLVMSYQFGTNWSVFSDKTGPILGPLMGYEVLSAFFLEAGFLGVMLFGMQKVGKRLHFLATLLVALVLVRPLETTFVNEECRRTTTGTLESFGDATEKEALRTRAGIVEIKDGAFLSIIGQGTQGSLASAPLVGTLETVWR